MPRTKTTGRPPALLEQRARTAFLEAVGNGVPLTHAATYAGVGQSTMFRALERGHAAADRVADPNDHTPLTPREREYMELREEVMRARSRVAVRNVGLVQRAAVGGQLKKEVTRRWRNDEGQVVTETEKEFFEPQWRAAMFLLQTSFAGDFGRQTQQVEVHLDAGTQALSGDGAGTPAGPSGEGVASVQAQVTAAIEQRQADAERDDAERDAEGVQPDADGVYDGVIVDEAEESP